MIHDDPCFTSFHHLFPEETWTKTSCWFQILLTRTSRRNYDSEASKPPRHVGVLKPLNLVGWIHVAWCNWECSCESDVVAFECFWSHQTSGVQTISNYYQLAPSCAVSPQLNVSKEDWGPHHIPNMSLFSCSMRRFFSEKTHLGWGNILKKTAAASASGRLWSLQIRRKCCPL